MELKDFKEKELIEEIKSRYDHVVIFLVQDGEGGKHHRTWKGNYFACMAMCGIIHSYILKAYEATMKLVSKKENTT